MFTAVVNVNWAVYWVPWIFCVRTCFQDTVYCLLCWMQVLSSWCNTLTSYCNMNRSHSGIDGGMEFCSFSEIDKTGELSVNVRDSGQSAVSAESLRVLSSSRF